ncbi:hypothetical protein ACQ4PT_012502 [Festuca glaucescens]
MEKVEGLMRNLKLSDAERKGLKIPSGGRSKSASADPKAMGKVFSEKPANAEGVANALGRIWCPLRGIHCKKVGENIFLITFYQASGKRKALDEGPWMFGNDLFVIEDFDENKDPEEYEFASFPIWVRVFKLPLGMMNRETAIALGAEIGEFIEADRDEEGMAYGQYLRIKIRMEITKPLMRGKMVQIGDEGKLKWCPFEYEFLPDFCFTCGKIGHIDKSCTIQLKEGEVQQYGKWLKRAPQQRGSGNYERPQRSNSNSGETRFPGSTGSKGSSTRSDSISWRKEGPFLLREADKKGEDREINSPRKDKKETDTQTDWREKKMSSGKKIVEEKNEMELMPTEKDENPQLSEIRKKGNMMSENTGTGSLIDIPVKIEWKQNKSNMEEKKKESKQPTFRRERKSMEGKKGNSGEVATIVGIKRTNMIEEMEVDTETVTKKVKKDENQENTSQMNAGLSELPCGDQ